MPLAAYFAAFRLVSFLAVTIMVSLLGNAALRRGLMRLCVEGLGAEPLRIVNDEALSGGT
jgi:hypothetical protein